MANNLHNHERRDKSKWFVTLIAFILAFVAIAAAFIGIFSDGFTNWDKFKTDEEQRDEQLPEEEQTDDTADGGAVISESEGKGMALTSVAIATADYDEYGISPMAETAYTLTATVQPDTSGEKTFDWSIKFQSASSSWANGKTVTDYVTVTPASDGANTATVECKQAFGEKILVTCSSRDYASLSATCTVDYAQRITGMDVILEGSRTGDRDILAGEEVAINFTYYGDSSSYNVYTVTATPIYSDVYTLAESATCKVSFLTSAGAGDGRTYFNGNEVTGSMGYYSRTYNDAVANAIGKTFSFDNHMFEAYNFRREFSVLEGGYPSDESENYADLTAEELAERYLTQDQDTVLWRVVASVEGKYGSYEREDSYIMYSWSSAGSYASLSLSDTNLIF